MRSSVIFGVPRSGTSWLGELVNASEHTCYKFQPLFSYAHKAGLNSCSTQNDIDNFFSRLVTCQDPFTCQSRERESGMKPSFQKDDYRLVCFKEVRYLNLLIPLLRNHPALKIIALIRNPFEVLDSWFSAPREFRSDLGWNPDEEWRYALKKNLNYPENFFGFEKWKEFYLSVQASKNLFSSRLHVVDYWKLKANALETVIEIYDFLGLPMTSQVHEFCHSSTSFSANQTYSVFKKTDFRQAISSSFLSAEANAQISAELSEIDYSL